MKKFYPYKIKTGSAVKMAEILIEPQLIDYRMDDKICRITTVDHNTAAVIKPEHLDTLADDQLYQVKAAYIDDREFLVLKSLLEPLTEIVTIEE